MTEATKATAKLAPAVRKPHIMNCGIAVSGAEFLPPKMLAIMDYFYSKMRPDTGVVAIIIRNDGRPTGDLGKAYPWAYSITLNVPFHLDRVWAKLSKKDFGLNLKDAVWLALLETWLHETIHVEMAHSDEEWFEAFVAAGDEKDIAETEKVVKEIAREMLIELARTVDIEGPAISDMGALAGVLMEKFMKQKDSDLIKRSEIMLEQGLVYKDETDKGKTVYHKTIRSFVRNCLVPSGNDEDWDNVNLVKLSFQMENGETVEAQAEAVINAADALGMPAPGTSSDDVEEDVSPDMEAVAQAFGEAVGEQIAGAAVVAPAVAPHAEIPGVVPVNAAGQAAVNAQAAPIVQPVVSDVAGGHVAAPAAEEFQLPAHIAAPTQTVANNMAPQPQAQPTTELPKLEIPVEKIKGCLQEVYQRLYNNMFLKCGWSVNPQTGRYHFPQPYAITASWQLSDILTRWGCDGLIVEYTSYAEGQQVTAQTKAQTRYTFDGNVRGFVYGEKNLPAIELFLNIGGHRIMRRLIPQNPDKVVNNAYTKGAEMAGAGNAILYVFTDATQDRPWKERCVAKIVNKEYQEQR